MSIATDFRAYLLTLSGITDEVGSRVHVNKVPQHADGTDDDAPTLVNYVWIGQRGTDREECIQEGDTEPDSYEFDVEMYSTDQTIGDSLMSAIKAIHEYAGAMGTTNVQGIFVDDHADDYLPRGSFEDIGTFSGSVLVTIWPR